MCKSQKWEYAGFPLIPPMLMSSELPNWLLLRALEGRKPAEDNRMTNLYPKVFSSPPAIPQAFPQRTRSLQVESSKVFRPVRLEGFLYQTTGITVLFLSSQLLL
jgi:hypothetical protein